MEGAEGANLCDEQTVKVAAIVDEDVETATGGLVDASPVVVGGAVRPRQPGIGQVEMCCYFILQPGRVHRCPREREDASRSKNGPELT